ncbi:ester cyclase [Luteibacter sp. PPL552]
MKKHALTTLLCLSVAGTASAAHVDDDMALALAAPRERIVDHSLSTSAVRALVEPATAFYGFWNNGSQALLDRAISPGFVDHTLPPGRPQGPSGPAAASKAFLAAVPDLKVTVTQQLVVGDRVVSHLDMAGHFTGTFQERQGHGETIHFFATDIVKVTNGRITDNWHLEDNLTLLKQLGVYR